MPKISVCIASYNGSKYIKDQLTSILEQLNEEAEVIISDDYSTDNTVEIIESLKDSRIRLMFPERKVGPVYNFENALKHAKGDIIFLADQDDIWMSNKVKEQVSFLENYDLVLSDAEVVDGNCNLLYSSFFKINYSGKGFIRNWVNNSFMGCCMAFNRRILDHVLPFPPKIAMHDIWIGLNASLIGKCKFYKSPLIKYRRHGGNTIVSFKKNHLPISYQISYRIHMMYHILKRYFSRLTN